MVDATCDDENVKFHDGKLTLSDMPKDMKIKFVLKAGISTSGAKYKDLSIEIECYNSRGNFFIHRHPLDLVHNYISISKSMVETPDRLAV